MDKRKIKLGIRAYLETPITSGTPWLIAMAALHIPEYEPWENVAAAIMLFAMTTGLWWFMPHIGGWDRYRTLKEEEKDAQDQ